MGQAIEALARTVAETRWDDFPAEIRQHAKLVLLDTLGVILAGSVQPEVERLRATLVAAGGTGATVYAHDWPATDPRTAALLNGVAGRSIELCEGHRYVSCQGAVQIVPAVLAAGEAMGADGRQILAGLIAGYDVAVRIGAGATARPLAHQNGQWPLLGAIAGVARLRGLSAEETSQAIRIGATLLVTPGYTNAVAGATALNVAGGLSSWAGLLAPDLALAGFAAQPDAVEEAFTHLAGDGFRPEQVTEELGTRWEIGRNYFRLRACCNPIYAALDALDATLADLNPAPDDLDQIEVATYRFASVMRNPNPPNYFASKYSLPHAAAARILRGTTGYAAFTEETVHDPAIAALRQRVTVVEDPALTAQFPLLKPARVTLTLKDGRQATRTCESPRGDFQDPYTEEEIRAKFRELAGLVLTPARIAAVEDVIDLFDRDGQVAGLVEVLRRPGRAG